MKNQNNIPSNTELVCGFIAFACLFIVLLFLLLCIVAVFTSNLAKIRKHTILVFAFILILLLALLQKRDDRVLQYDQ